MNLNEYQKRAMATNAKSSDNESYSLFGLMAEVGEIADKIAKGVRKELITIDRDFIYEGRKAGLDEESTRELMLFYEGMKKELGDVLWFVAHLAHRFSWELEDVAQCNLEKLEKRRITGTIINHEDH